MAVLSTELNSWNTDCMACKAEKLYLAFYRKCLRPLNGNWTVGNRRHSGKDLGVRWKGRRG